MTSTARHHAEWLSLIEVSGPFLSMPVLTRAFPQGLDPHDPAVLRAVRLAFGQWEESQDARPDPALHGLWTRFVLRDILGFPDAALAEGQSIPETVKASIPEHGETLRPDLMVVNPPGVTDAGRPRILVHIAPPRQPLNRPLPGARWKASPESRLTELLRGSGVPLGLLTNGEQWMLVHAPAGETAGCASWYAPLWLEEHLTLRAFRSLLSAHRFFSVAEPDTLEALLAASATDQQEVTDQLGWQVRRAVEMLVQALDRIDKDRGRALLAGADERNPASDFGFRISDFGFRTGRRTYERNPVSAERNPVSAEKELYQAALTVMMRLVFLFSAEERGLLLLGDPLYDQHYAVSTLRAQLREAADQLGEEVLERRNDAWSRLLAVFRAVHGGVRHEAMRLPAYGGALFDPDRFPFLEGRPFGWAPDPGDQHPGPAAPPASPAGPPASYPVAPSSSPVAPPSPPAAPPSVAVAPPVGPPASPVAPPSVAVVGAATRDAGPTGAHPPQPYNRLKHAGAGARPLPVNNRTVLHLLEALQVLQVKAPGGGPAEARLLSFRALDVEQIGHVYEGLLDHTAVRAAEPVLGLAGTRDRQPEVPLALLEAARTQGEDALLSLLGDATGRSVSALGKALAGGGQLPVVSGQLPVVSGQLPVVSGQLPVVSGQLPVVSGQLPATGSPPVLATGNSQLSSGQLPVVSGQLPAAGSPSVLATGNWQLNEQRLRAACDNDDALLARVTPFAGLLRADTFGEPVVITPGSVYVTQGTDRRTSGTHYTPRSLTEPIVRRTLEPLVYRGVAAGVEPSPSTLRPPADILALKVCDMTAGSGAFLVQACRYLSERLVESWEAVERANPGRILITPEGELSAAHLAERLLPADPEERLSIARRLIADRCLYGVDKNPMAVEMAKLSLWLITLQKERPFTFLDHALKCGDSLLGVDVRQLQTWSLARRGSGAVNLDVFLHQPIKEARDYRQRLAAMPEATVEDVRAKERLHRAAEERTALLKLAGDLIVAPCFLEGSRAAQEEERQRLYAWFIALRTDENRQALRERADALLAGRPTFHWPLEFPEVFDGGQASGLSPAPGAPPGPTPALPPSAGFDAIIGNPPFMGGQKITGALGVPYREWLVGGLGQGKRGSADLVAYFYLQAFGLLRPGGAFGLIATNTIAEGDTREVGLDQIVADQGQIYAATRSQKWPGTASLEVALAHVCHGGWLGRRLLDGTSVAAISAFLDDGAAGGKPLRLRANAGKSFQGSIVLGMGFVMPPEEAQALIAKDPRNADVLFPYLNGEDLNSRPDQSPSRWVINFRDWPLSRESAPPGYAGPVAADYPDCLAIVEAKVMPERAKLNRAVRRERWWQYAERAPALYATIAGMERVLALCLVTQYVAIAFQPTVQVFAHRLVVFPLQDNGSFALLQSSFHDPWARTYSSRLETRLNYSPSDCFETFPFPATTAGLDAIGAGYYAHRQEIMQARQEGLTKTYNRFHNPACQDADVAELRRLHAAMDLAVRDAYGWQDLELDHGFHATEQGVRYTICDAARRAVLARLLALNHQRAAVEAAQAPAARGKGAAAKGGARRASKAPGAGQLGLEAEVPPPARSDIHAQYEDVLARYHELVDRKHSRQGFSEQGFSEREAADMEALGRELDALDEPFYAPILERLRKLVADLQSDGTACGGQD